MENSQKDKVDCIQCVYFAVTWEPKAPRACKFFGFKTAQMPSRSVMQSSGAPCEAFQQKKKKMDMER